MCIVIIVYKNNRTFIFLVQKTEKIVFITPTFSTFFPPVILFLFLSLFFSNSHNPFYSFVLFSNFLHVIFSQLDSKNGKKWFHF